MLTQIKLGLFRYTFYTKQYILDVYNTLFWYIWTVWKYYHILASIITLIFSHVFSRKVWGLIFAFSSVHNCPEPVLSAPSSQPSDPSPKFPVSSPQTPAPSSQPSDPSPKLPVSSPQPLVTLLFFSSMALSILDDRWCTVSLYTCLILFSKTQKQGDSSWCTIGGAGMTSHASNPSIDPKCDDDSDHNYDWSSTRTFMLNPVGNRFWNPHINRGKIKLWETQNA